MEPVYFPEHNEVLGKNQPEYLQLPVHYGPDGQLAFCWKLSPEELAKVMETGEIWHQVLTFQGPLQPQMLMVDKPELR